jgi:hypothetical protein
VGNSTSMTSTSEPHPRPRAPRPEPDPVANDRRRARRRMKLPPDAACAICGETNLFSLLAVDAPKSILEGHHAVTEVVDDKVIVVLCLTHHAQATTLQWDVGALIAGDSGVVLDKMVLAMRSLGSFFELLADAFYRWAELIAGVIAALEEHFPSWRALPGMP